MDNRILHSESLIARARKFDASLADAMERQNMGCRDDLANDWAIYPILRCLFDGAAAAGDMVLCRSIELGHMEMAISAIESASAMDDGEVG